MRLHSPHCPAGHDQSQITRIGKVRACAAGFGGNGSGLPLGTELAVPLTRKLTNGIVDHHRRCENWAVPPSSSVTSTIKSTRCAAEDQLAVNRLGLAGWHSIHGHRPATESREPQRENSSACCVDDPQANAPLRCAGKSSHSARWS